MILKKYVYAIDSVTNTIFNVGLHDLPDIFVIPLVAKVNWWDISSEDAVYDARNAESCCSTADFTIY